MIQNKVDQLLKLTNNFVYPEYYSHTSQVMWKIDNEYTDLRKDTLVLCTLGEGLEKALNYAIKNIQVKKALWIDGGSFICCPTCRGRGYIYMFRGKQRMCHTCHGDKTLLKI